MKNPQPQQDQYNLNPMTLEFLPVGHDYNAGVYRVLSDKGAAYLLKATSRPLKEVGSIFKQIHQVTVPRAGFESLRKETFDPTVYTQWIHTFETQHVHSEGKGTSERALHSSWAVHQPTIHHVVTSLEKR